MTKSAEAFRTISEVAEWLDTPTHVLRFWESKFSQIKPVKRAGGRRYYRPQDMLLIGGIKKLLHSDGFTIKAVRKILLEQGQKYVCNLSKPLGGSRNLPEVEPDETVVAESDAPVNKAGWKPIGFTKLVTDLSEDGKMVEPNPAERDLRDLAIKQIDASEKAAVEESIASDTMNTAKTFELSDTQNGAPGEGISDMKQEVNSDLNSQVSEIPNAPLDKSKRAPEMETKKSLDMFDDNQPMFNFWSNDDETSESESSSNIEETTDQEKAFPANADHTTLNEISNSALAEHLSEKIESDNSVIDQAEHQELDQDLERANVAINTSGQDEVSDASVAGPAVSTQIDGLVTVDNVAENAKLFKEEAVQTHVGATLRSIENHLDRHPIVSPLQAKALRTGLTALGEAIAKRRLPTSME